MEERLTKEKKRSLLQVILTSGFLAAASTALIIYINSSFLETIIPEEWVGYLFSVSYFLTLIIVQSYGRMITHFKNHVVLLAAFAIQIFALLSMAWNAHPLLTLLAFVVLIICYNVTVINYDVLLEVISKDRDTGRIRGIFWTVVNLAYVVSPIISGALIARFDFYIVYLLGAILLMPSWIMIFLTYRKNGHEKFKKHAPIIKTLRRIWKNHDLRGIYIIAFMLYFFYSWMVIYTPLYLLELEFGWDQIGVMFTIMLIPFVIIEYPAGWLADKYFGETEMLTMGLSLMGLMVITLLFVSSFWAVVAVLFFSRVGASLVEIMRDTYFYKKVKADDLDLIDTFRNMRSLAYVIGPVLASAILGLGYSLAGIFVVLAVILFISTIVPFTIKDTK